MFCKGGVYFGLDIPNARIMHDLLGEILEKEEEGNSNESEGNTT